jgi:mannose-6-phosphate isomerase
MQKAYKLQGVHRHYDWGGTEFIPNLMKVKNESNKPFAEYWMGAHASAPALIDTENGLLSINEFGTIPYLFKILDVAKMLSIQVHPTKENALIGFELEQKAGIVIDAPNRNYKDQNHKPEVMVALSDFWLLHGFLAPDLLNKRLQSYNYFHSLLDHFKESDYQGLYQFFMQLSAQDADKILKPLMEDAVASVKSGEVNKAHPHWWANKYYNDIVPESNIDKGIISIYILNIVSVKKYQAVFQGAGLLHAYLEGQNIELMANSDNVLRGGLTPKHIDIDELLKHVNFAPTYPEVLTGDNINNQETIYPCPVKDFGLSKIVLNEGESYTIKSQQIEMLLIMEGEVDIDGLIYKPGEVAMVKPLQEIILLGIQPSVMFKSFVP